MKTAPLVAPFGPGSGGEPGHPLERLLAGRPMTAARWGLERIETMLSGLGRPELAFDAVHVAGTNGKGSTASFTAAALRAAGLRTGLYTSPHLVDVRERFVADGRPLPDELLRRGAEIVAPLADQTGATYFEATTALAFVCFAELGLDWAVVETGLGGRLDATTALEPRVCCITHIGLDHTDFLGPTLPDIAAEKAGILKPNVPAVVTELTSDLRHVIMRRALSLGAPLRWLGEDARIDSLAVDAAGTSFTYSSERFPEGLRLRTGLTGRHQAENAALAVMAVEEALPEAASASLGDCVRRGLRDARIDGRLQAVAALGTTWLLDIAHNRSGVSALAKALGDIEPPHPRVFLAGILRDKPWREMLKELAAQADRLIVTVAPSAPEGRACTASELREWLAQLPPWAGGESVELQLDFDDAVARARELSAGGTVVVTGSAHTVGDVLRRLTTSGGG